MCIRDRTGRALTVSLTPEAMQMVRMVANRNPDSPYLFPILQSEEAVSYTHLEGGRWGTAHIYQSAVNAFSAFTKWQPMPMRKLSPTVLKRFENFLRQRNCSWNTVSTYIKTVRSVYHRAVDRKYIRYVPRLFEHVYTGTRADRKKALEASDISSLVRETERSLQRGTLPNTQQRTRIFFVLMFMLRGCLLYTSNSSFSNITIKRIVHIFCK